MDVVFINLAAFNLPAAPGGRKVSKERKS